MTDEVWRRDEVDSPCLKICVMHPEAKLCIGCYRTIEEIGTWSRLDSDKRRAILAQLDGRKAQVGGKRRGGRARNRPN